jgi:regulator of replication initiation timing
LTYEKQKSREQYTDKIQDLRHEKELLKSEMSEMKATDLGKTIAENRQLKAENERLRDDLASARQQVRQYENVLEMAQISHSRGRER